MRRIVGVDRRSVAVGLQYGATGVEHRCRRKRQVVACGEPDGAGHCTAGIDDADDGQAAAVDRDRYLLRPHLVADDKITLLDVERTRAEEACIVQLEVQRGEIPEVLRRDADLAIIVSAGGGALQRTAERHDPMRRIVCGGGDGAGVIVPRRDVDGRARGLDDVAMGTFQYQIAAPAVLRNIVERDAATGEIDHGVAAEIDIVRRIERQLAAWQRHRRIQKHAVAAERQSPAESGNRRGAGHPARRRDDTDRAAGVIGHGRALLAGQKRCGQGEVATLQVARAILRQSDRQGAVAVCRDPVAGTDIDIGKSEREAVESGTVGRPAVSVVAKDDVPCCDVERARTGPGPARQDSSRRFASIRDAARPTRTVTGPHTIPHQRVGGDAGGIACGPEAIDRRRVDDELHTLPTRRLTSRIERDSANQIEGPAGCQRELLECRHSRRRRWMQQPVEHALGQVPAGRQDARSLRRREGRIASSVDHILRHGEIARAKIDVAHGQRTGGRKHDAAFGQQRCAVAHVDCSGADHRQEVEPPVRHRQHSRSRRIGDLRGRIAENIAER